MKIRSTKIVLSLLAIGIIGTAGLAKVNAVVDGPDPDPNPATQTYTFPVANRSPFGLLNLSGLYIKPTTSTTGIILNGYVIKIDPHHNTSITGQIRVEEICDEYGGNCNQVSTLGNGGGGDGYWKTNGGSLETSGGNYSVAIKNWLSVSGTTTLSDNLNIQNNGIDVVGDSSINGNLLVGSGKGGREMGNPNACECGIHTAGSCNLGVATPITWTNNNHNALWQCRSEYGGNYANCNTVEDCERYDGYVAPDCACGIGVDPTCTSGGTVQTINSTSWRCLCPNGMTTDTCGTTTQGTTTQPNEGRCTNTPGANATVATGCEGCTSNVQSTLYGNAIDANASIAQGNACVYYCNHGYYKSGNSCVEAKLTVTNGEAALNNGLEIRGGVTIYKNGGNSIIALQGDQDHYIKYNPRGLRIYKDWQYIIGGKLVLSGSDLNLKNSNLIVTGSMKITQDAKFKSGIIVDKDSSFSQNLTVSGTTTLQGTTFLDSGLTVKRKDPFGSSISALSIGSITFPYYNGIGWGSVTAGYLNFNGYSVFNGQINIAPQNASHTIISESTDMSNIILKPRKTSSNTHTLRETIICNESLEGAITYVKEYSSSNKYNGALLVCGCYQDNDEYKCGRKYIQTWTSTNRIYTE